MITTATHKLPSILPHDMSAERMILGVILAGGLAGSSAGPVAQARRVIRREHFYSPAFQELFTAALTVNDRGDQVTPKSVIEEMLLEGTIGMLRHDFDIGDPQAHPGWRFLTSLAELAPPVHLVKETLGKLSDACARLEDLAEERDRLREATDKAEAYQRNRDRFIRQHAPQFLAQQIGALVRVDRPDQALMVGTVMVRIASELAGEQFDFLEGAPVSPSMMPPTFGTMAFFRKLERVLNVGREMAEVMKQGPADFESLRAQLAAALADFDGAAPPAGEA